MFVILLAIAMILWSIAMVLSLTDPNTVFRKARGGGRSAATQEALRGLSQHINQIGNPDLQLVTFSGLETADQVIANVPCVLFAVYVRKPSASTVNSWLKGSNSTTAAAASGDLVIFLQGTSGGGREYCPTFGDGLPFGTGLTIGAHTANNGSSKSLVADAPTGFAIIGAAL
jgi:hypothetical protein